MLDKLVAGLKGHEDVIARTAAKVGAQVEAVARPTLVRHVDTGAALASLRVEVSGGLITLTSNRYCEFIPGWKFRGRMPPFIVSRARDLFAAEFLAIFGETGALGSAAASIVADASSREAARADRKAQAKKDAQRRREERAYDRKVKKEESRHG